jgi:hypothetical protein
MSQIDIDQDQRAKVFASDDLGSSLMNVPEWDMDVTIKGMTAMQRITLVDRADGDKGYMYSDILIELAYNTAGDKHLFDEADREALSEKSGGVQERLALEALRISGVSTDDADEEVAEDPTSDGS